MASGTRSRTAGKNNKPIIKIASMTIAGILVASIVAISVSMSSAKPFVMEENNISSDPHDPRILTLHSHVQLELSVNGKPLALPANVGIDPLIYNNHSLDQYAATDGMAPIHTHSADGLIHIESTVVRDYTMEEFMSIWGIDFDQIRAISMSVDGKVVEDHKNHKMKDGQHIILDIDV